jgi:hypothetical protein
VQGLFHNVRPSNGLRKDQLTYETEDAKDLIALAGHETVISSVMNGHSIVAVRKEPLEGR